MTNKQKKRALVAICLFALLLNLSAFAADGAEIRTLVSQLGKEAAADPDLPGLSIAVLKKGGGEPVAMAFGVACVENDVPMTPDSMIKIGSITKVFTAALIHRLIEKGQLDHDTTIDRFFPSFPDGDKIKIRHLLTHTSGIMDMLHLEAVYTNLTKCWPPDELIAMAGAGPRSFAPGTGQKYSNTGYLMLARIAEKVSGQNYEEQIREIFCEKLGMKSLRTGSDTAIVPKLSGGYTSSPEAGLSLPLMASIAIAKGAGNLLASPRDVVRMVNIGDVLKDNVFDSGPLAPLMLDNGMRSEFVADNGGWTTTQSYLDGCALFIFEDPGITVVGHLGSFPGFGTVYFYDRETAFAVAISVNNERKITNAMLLGAKILSALRTQHGGAQIE